MKKIGFLFMSLATLLMVGVAHANYILNPGFEDHSGNDFAYWTEGGVVKAMPYPVYEGTTSALLGVNGGSLYQTFNVTDGSSLSYGAYFLIGTTSLDSNWDQVQISLQVDSLDWTTIGGSVSNFIGVTDFEYDSSLGYYISDWFMISNTVDLPYVPVLASININTQNYSDPLTKVFVDNAFAFSTTDPDPTGFKPVPEPATLLLFGSGLLGLLRGARRKLFR